MIETTKTLLSHQIDAALRMVGDAVDACPEEAWNAPVCDLAFCQAVFHALFFTDCYLGPDTESLRQQPFHREHPEFFRDYEELQDKKQELLYDQPTVKKYLLHCRTKAQQVIAAETERSFTGPCGFDWLKFSRAELYAYNLRHIQHHAAQLMLRLRLDYATDFAWAKSSNSSTPVVR